MLYQLSYSRLDAPYLKLISRSAWPPRSYDHTFKLQRSP